MARKVPDLNVLPPTRDQIQTVLGYLRNACFLEHACVLAGIPSVLLERWLTLGRQGKPGFVEFVGAIDRANADLSKMITDAHMDAARTGDLGALRWIHDKRLAQRETHRMRRILAQEDAVLDQQAETIGSEDMEAAQQRLIDALDAQLGVVH